MINYYLIQTGEIKEPDELAEAVTMLGSCDWDYMGSSEFEFGELPKGIGRLLITKDELVTVEDLTWGKPEISLTAVVRSSQVSKLRDFFSNFNKYSPCLKEDFNLDSSESIALCIDESLEFIVCVSKEHFNLIMSKAEDSFNLLKKNRWIPEEGKLNHFFISK